MLIPNRNEATARSAFEAFLMCCMLIPHDEQFRNFLVNYATTSTNVNSAI